MKTNKLFFLISLLFLSSISYGQLTLDVNGNTIFGNKDVISTGISITDLSTVNRPYPFKVIRSGDGNMVGVFRYNVTTDADIHRGRGIRINHNGAVFVGQPFDAMNHNLMNYPGLFTLSGYYHPYIFDLYTDMYTDAIRLQTKNSNNIFSETFKVNRLGEVYSTGVRLTSDISLKKEIETIPSPLEKIMQLRGVTYQDNLFTDQAKAILKETYEKAKEKNPEITSETFRQIQSEKSRKRMGVVAQEVEKVIPEVIRTREDGLKTVAYSELVGLLIEAVKEQQGMIDKLNREVASLKSSQEMKPLKTTAFSETITGIDHVLSGCILSQNTPNPFTEQTEISYFLSSGMKDAFICVFDLKGKTLMKLEALPGNKGVTIPGSQLQAGVYMYSLVVGGQIVDTKQMILTR